MSWSYDSLGKKSILSHSSYRLAVIISIEELLPRIIVHNQYDETFWTIYLDTEIFPDPRRHIVIEISDGIYPRKEFHRAVLDLFDHIERVNFVAYQSGHGVLKFFITCKIDIGSGIRDNLHDNQLLETIITKSNAFVVNIKDKSPINPVSRRTFHDVLDLFPELFHLYRKEQHPINKEYFLIKDKPYIDTLDMKTLDDSISSVVPSKAMLGFCGFQDHDHLDSFLLHSLSHIDIGLIMIDGIKLPNIQSMTIDLVHSFGLECFAEFHLLDVFDNHNKDIQVYESLSRLYEVSNRMVLLKCLLQLGIVITIHSTYNHHDRNKKYDQRISKLTDEEKQQFQDDLARICHTFVHRKAFVSAVRVITLTISPEDLEKFVALSESIEMQRYHQQEQFWKGHPPPPQLDFDSDNIL